MRVIALGVGIVTNLILAAAGRAGEPAKQDQRAEFTQLLMGVQARVVVYAPDAGAAEEGAKAVFERIAALEQVMSDYRVDSELTLLNRSAGDGARPVSEDLWKALEQSVDIGRKTDGAFDVAVGPVVKLWRETRKSGVLPARADLTEARARSGLQLLELDGLKRTARLTVSGMALDLGGIGKGIAAQEGVKVLKARGLGRCMVALSGDIAVGDAPPEKEGWRIAVDTGYENGKAMLRLVNSSISTSGDAEQFVEIGGGTRYSHIVDPGTGLGSTRRAAACVVGRDGGVVDALATALSVVGAERGRAVLARFEGVEGMVVEGGERMESAGFQALMYGYGPSNPPQPREELREETSPPASLLAERGAASPLPLEGTMFDPQNEPPAGFTALFSGKDLAGCQGLIDGPPVVNAMKAEERAKAQAAADERMRKHWRAENGVLVFDGKGDSLQSSKNYKDFELYVDWMIQKGGDSGIYLRGSPQVQIWDNPEGSGGLYNNEKHLSRPLAIADHKTGEWNRFHIIMRGERVSVALNGVLVVDDQPLENYWERDRAIYPTGPIELQNHGNELRFKNIFVREIPEAAPPTEKDKRMAWWREARFGMFIHWGLYAIPAGEWNGKVYDSASEWLMDQAKIPPEEYEKLAPKFNPVKFDPNAWADIAHHAGMRYVVITTKHHDGFCLFDSAETDYDIMDAAPFKRDIMKELSESVRSKGLRMCWYHSIMDWHQPDANKANWEKYAPVLRKQVTEILTKYGPIGVMWFDGEWKDEWTTEQGKSLYELCRSLQPDVIVNNRVGKGRQGMQGFTKEGDHPGDFGTPEQEVPRRGIAGVDWETCMTMNESWGFHRTDLKWKSAKELIRMLADTSSKGGNFLLNVGPTELGEIPAASVERLRAMGAWMWHNSPSIYGTEAGPFDRLSWGRCTAKEEAGGTTLYLHVFDWPEGGVLEVPGLMNEVRRAYVLATPSVSLKAEASGGGVRVMVPAKAPDENDTVIALELFGKAAVVEQPIRQGADGSVLLDAGDADIHGSTAQYEADAEHRCIGFWTNEKDSVSWDFRVERPGSFIPEIEWACEDGDAGSEIKIEIQSADGGKQQAVVTVESTGAWTKFQTRSIGSVNLEVGSMRVSVVPVKKANNALMNLRAVRLRPE